MNNLKDKFLSRWKYSERKAVSELWDLRYQDGALHPTRHIVLQIKNGEIKEGDTVFYYPYEEFATIIELPSSSNVSTLSDATIRISSGGTRKVRLNSLWKWWSGNEKDEELNKQITKKITVEAKDKAREIIEKEIKPIYVAELLGFIEIMELTEITDNGIMKISIFGDIIDYSEEMYTIHYDIEYGIKLSVPAVKAVIVDFHSKDGSSHIVVGT